jgi:hypothetical protein
MKLSEIERRRHFYVTPKIVAEQLIAILKHLETIDEFSIHFPKLDNLDINVDVGYWR